MQNANLPPEHVLVLLSDTVSEVNVSGGRYVAMLAAKQAGSVRGHLEARSFVGMPSRISERYMGMGMLLSIKRGLLVGESKGLL